MEPTGSTYSGRNWRVAKSLDTLIGQANRQWPARSKSADGTIGDTAHSQHASGHNPNKNGAVCAWDMTHDPKHGADGHTFSENLRLSKDHRIAYVIFARRIFDGGEWKWKPYSGASPHTDHVHISVSQNPHLYDDATPWPVFAPPPSQHPTLRKGDKGGDVHRLQVLLKKHGRFYDMNTDGQGNFGSQTDWCVHDFQARWAVKSTGVVDAATWRWLEVVPHRPVVGVNSGRHTPSLVVVELQGLLDYWAGANNLGGSGRVDAATVKAWQEFQRAHGLPVKDVVDAATWRELDKPKTPQPK